MKTAGGKKKTTKKEAEFIKDENVIEVPKNLLPDHTEDTTEPVVEEKTELKKEEEKESKEEAKVELKIEAKEAIKEEVKPVVETVVQEVKPPESEPIKTEVEPETEKKDDLPFIDNKPIDLTNEVLTPAPSSTAPPPIPPISVPITRMNTDSTDGAPKIKKIFGILLLILIVLVVGGVSWHLSSKAKKDVVGQKLVIFKPTGVIESPTPTSVASAAAKLEEYQIEVLNGSGVSGEASKVQNILEDGGFEVSDTGNADAFDYTDTIIQAKKEVEKTFLDKLKTLLNKTYSVGKDEVLDSSDSSDIVIIVGSTKAK